MSQRFDGPYILIPDGQDWYERYFARRGNVVRLNSVDSKGNRLGHSLLFSCPCEQKCGNVNLPIEWPGHNGEGPWQASFDIDGRLTLSPSIQMTSGCNSHFHIRDGKVEWC